MKKEKKPVNSAKAGGDVQTHIKNQELVELRRRQIIDAAVHLLIEKGFHKTTTRQIAAAAGLSSGSMYEYVASKEDILYLVCDAIHAEVEKSIADVMARAGTGHDVLPMVIREYFKVCDRMSDHILLIYQESQSLPRQWRKKVLEREVRITGIFIRLIRELIEAKDLPELDDSTVDIMAHDITVLGHMWTFRRWFFGRKYSVEEYTRVQTDFVLGMCRARGRP